MKTAIRILSLGLVAGSLLTAVGCATPANRIKKRPDVFNRFPPEVQENVRQGQIDIGYTKDMTLMALGSPDRQYTRKTHAGVTEIWSYTTVDYPLEPFAYPESAWVVDRWGRRRYVSSGMWATRVREEVRDRIRVEFVDDKVQAIEYLK